jgi:hypothetical protein
MNETTLTVEVNREEYEVPNTVQTVSDFFDALGWPAEDYHLYRIDGNDEIGPLGEMLVFDSGDRFVAVPKYVDDGG